MKSIFALLVLAAALSSCASAPQFPNVNLDECQERGVIDGKRVGTCPAVESVK